MEEKITNLETNYALMAQKIDTLSKNTDELKHTLTSYIAEDRLWKENLCNNLDKRYAHKLEVYHLKTIMYAVIGALGTLIAILITSYLDKS
jgi:hypothetical protein